MKCKKVILLSNIKNKEKVIIAIKDQRLLKRTWNSNKTERLENNNNKNFSKQ